MMEEIGSAAERELVAAYQTGDPAAYEQIDAAYRPLVTRICMDLLRDPHATEDAVQETFLRVSRGLPTFNGRYRLEAWIVRIARNHCIDILRTRSRTPELIDIASIERASTELDPLERVARSETVEEVRRTLRAMPRDHATALIRREFDGYGHEAIALELKTTPPRAKALLHRARSTFKTVWAKSPGVLAWVIFVLLRRGKPEPGAPAGKVSVGAVTLALASAGFTVAQRTLPVFDEESPSRPTFVHEQLETPPAVIGVEPNARPAKEPRRKPQTTPERSTSGNSGHNGHAPIPVVPPDAADLPEAPSGNPNVKSPDKTPVVKSTPRPPEYHFSAYVDARRGRQCGCSRSVSILRQQVSGSLDQVYRASQTLTGRASDAEGGAWGLYLEHSSVVDRKAGSAWIEFVLSESGTGHQYQAQLNLVDIERHSKSKLLVFRGTVTETDTQDGRPLEPGEPVELVQEVWKDGRTLIGVTLTLG